MSQTPLAKQRHRRAIFLMFCALAILICLDASGKFLGGRGVPVEASAWSRYLGHLIVAAVIFLPRDGLRVFRPERAGVQWARGALMLLVTLLYFGALKYLPLAEATALFFVTPILTTLLASWFLGEYPSRLTVLSIVLGFAGVLVVVRPGVELVPLGIALVLLAAACNAGYQTLTRAASKAVAQKPGAGESLTVAANPALSASSSTEAVPPIRGERTGTQLIYSGLVGAVIMTASLPFWWSGQWLQTADLLTRAVFMGLGALGAFGHLLLIRAYSLAPAPVLTPWMYLQLALSVLLGWVIFGALPDWLTLVGMLVIALAPQLTRLDQPAKSKNP
jgi:drug/metabolite transporter (DMT)-like permease